MSAQVRNVVGQKLYRENKTFNIAVTLDIQGAPDAPSSVPISDEVTVLTTKWPSDEAQKNAPARAL